MVYQILGHVVRRGVEDFQSHYAARQPYIEQLEQDAELYQKAGLGEVQPREFLPFLITGLVGLFIVWSVSRNMTPRKSALCSC